MYFKNIRAYRIKDDVVKQYMKNAVNPEPLNEAMAEKEFMPCSPMAFMSCGWVEPLPKASEAENQLVLNHDYCSVICLKVENKVLPAKAVNEQVEKLANEIYEKEKRKVTRKEKIELKESVISDCLPKSLTVSNLIYAYIDWNCGLLIVNSSSAKDAEMLINYMRETIGSFPVIPIHASMVFHNVVGSWVEAGSIPSDYLSFAGSIDMASLADPSSKVRFISYDDTDHARELIADGFAVTKLSLSFKDIAEFTLDRELAIKKVSMSDLNSENLTEIDDPVSLWLAEFHIQAALFRELTSVIILTFNPDIENVKAEEQTVFAGI